MAASVKASFAALLVLAGTAEAQAADKPIAPPPPERVVAALAKMQEYLLVEPDAQLLVLTASEALRSAAPDATAFDACTASSATPGDAKSNYAPVYVPIRRAFACLTVAGAGPEQLDAAADKAVSAAMARFDPAGSWLNAADFERLLKPAAGLGVALKKTTDGPLVVSAPTNAPGYLGGLRRGDHILAIDGKPVERDKLDPVIDAIRGEAGSRVMMQVRHADDTIADLALTRGVLAAQTFKIETDRQGPVLLLKVQQMTTGISQQVRAALAEQAQPVGLLVLDLRYNSGGLLDESIALADVFLRKADIATVVERQSRFNETYRARSEQLLAGLPMVVWVDQVTASGAEIVAAALQDAGRATVVGQITFGLGRIQTLVPVDRRHALKITTGQVLRANGKPLADTHVKPDCPADPERLTLQAMAPFIGRVPGSPCPELPQSAPESPPAAAR